MPSEIFWPMSTYSLDDCRMALTTAHYEQEYDRTIRQTMHLLEIERCRIKDMQHLLLQFENDSLQMQLNQNNRELVKLKEAESNLHTQLNETRNEVDRLKNLLHVSSYEADNLRSELASLSNAAVETKKLMDENVRLSRDLANLRSEAESIKLQHISSQNIVAEKQALTRQLNTIEEQFENEKRAHERTQSRETHLAEQIAMLSSKLEETRKELAEQLQARERQERSAHHQVHESEAQRGALDGKLVHSNRKLRLTKDQEVRGDTQQRRINPRAPGAELPTKSRAMPLQRSTTQFVPELTIATPGAIQTRDRGKQPSALPGDKSSFSITPFLKRASGLQDSLSSSDDDLSELRTVAVSARTPNKFSNKVVTTDNVTVGSEDVEASSSRDGLPSKHIKKSASIRIRSNAAKAIPAKLRSPRPEEQSQADGAGLSLNCPSDNGQMKPKKRKLAFQREKSLLGDEEDLDIREVKKPGRKLAFGSGRNTSGDFQLTAQSSVLQSRGFGAFTEFSPLKRDRRRV